MRYTPQPYEEKKEYEEPSFGCFKGLGGIGLSWDCGVLRSKLVPVLNQLGFWLLIVDCWMLNVDFWFDKDISISRLRGFEASRQVAGRGPKELVFSPRLPRAKSQEPRTKKEERRKQIKCICRVTQGEWYDRMTVWTYERMSVSAYERCYHIIRESFEFVYLFLVLTGALIRNMPPYI